MSNQLDIVEAQAIEEAWAAEVEHRIDAIESGRATLIPAAASIARARAAICE